MVVFSKGKGAVWCYGYRIWLFLIRKSEQAVGYDMYRKWPFSVKKRRRSGVMVTAMFLALWRGCKNSFPTVFKVFHAVLKRKFSFFVENDDYWRKIGVGSFSTVKEWAEEVPVVPSTGPLYFWCRIAKMCFLSFSASVLTGTALFLFENDIKYWKRQFLGYIRCLKI